MKRTRGFLDPWTLGLVVAFVGAMTSLALRPDNTELAAGMEPEPAHTPLKQARAGDPEQDIGW